MAPRGRVNEHLKPHHSKKADTISLAPKRIDRFLTVMQLNAMNGLFSFFLPNDTVETCQLFDRAICHSDLTIVYMLKWLGSKVDGYAQTPGRVIFFRVLQCSTCKREPK